MSEEKDRPAEPQDKPPEQPKLSHEEFMRRLRADPRFVVHEPRGEAFIIGGQRPIPPKKPDDHGA
jgi:hypothetical protein